MNSSVFAGIVIGYSIISQAIEKEPISIIFPMTKFFQIKKHTQSFLPRAVDARADISKL